jgi:2-oxoglutarate ferredoxin oxidoreductase subunit gamma
MLNDKHVSWFPSYGPEMRGGTTNCGVIISDSLIGSPVFLNPEILLCLNGPSFDKFEPRLAPGGVVFVDSSLTDKKAADGVNAHYIPATQLAYDHGLDGLGNMIILGKVMKECGLFDYAAAEKAMINSVSERRQDMVENNMKALKVGMAL